MIIKSLELLDYRNYHRLQMNFDRGTNILYGDNAQGKTNILESIYVCATTKSHRGSRDREMIRFDQEESHIRLFIERDAIEHKIDIHLKRNKTKGAAIDGIPIKKSSELMGMLNVVFFSPEDLTIIKNGPAERRHFIDMELCQLNRVYLHDISNYNKSGQSAKQSFKTVLVSGPLKVPWMYGMNSSYVMVFGSLKRERSLSVS